MIICAVDFESNGLDTKEARITEIGAVCFEPHEFGLSKKKGMCTLVYGPDYIPQSEEVLQVTGITDEMLFTKGISFVNMVQHLVQLFEAGGWPDYFIAHNKDFDENLFKWEMKRHKEDLLGSLVGSEMPRLFSIPWLCSIDDIEHPGKRCMKLPHLALDYGLAVNPNDLHRALDDVNLLVDLLEYADVDFDHVIERSKVPWVIIRALIPPPFGRGNDGGRGKEAAYKAGFKWQEIKWAQYQGKIFNKMWVKRVKADQIEEEEKQLGYKVAIIE